MVGTITALTGECQVAPKRKAKDRDGLHRRRNYWHYELIIDGKKRSFTTGLKDYNQAKKKRAQAVADLENGRLPVDSSRKRFDAAASEYIAHREATVSVGTVRIDKERLPHLKRSLGNCLLKDITAKTIRAYQASRAAQVSPRTVNLEVKLLRGILTVEGQWKRLADDVKPLREAGEKVGRSLSDEEALNLFALAESNAAWLVAYLATVLANDTGMRGVEIRNLRIGDIDTTAKTITIRKSKNDTGLRTVILTGDALNAVNGLLDRAKGEGSFHCEHYLIPARIKGDFDPTAPTKGWRTAWRSLRKKAGLGKFRFHDLRHTWVTTHAELGTPIQVLQAQAGHLSKKMTDLYTHISQRAMEKAAENFEKSKADRITRARGNKSGEQRKLM